MMCCTKFPQQRADTPLVVQYFLDTMLEDSTLASLTIKLRLYIYKPQYVPWLTKERINQLTEEHMGYVAAARGGTSCLVYSSVMCNR
jgi:hypothetical protein